MSLITQRHGILWTANNGSAPTPVLPSHTIRCKFSSGYTPTMGDTQTLVDAGENIWDIYKSSNDWNQLFSYAQELVEVVDANATGVTNMSSMFFRSTNLTSVCMSNTTGSVTHMTSMFDGCTSLTTVPLLDTSSSLYMNYAFVNCRNVQSGALALYQQASTQATPPTYYTGCFANCGSDAPADAPIHAEMQQIPSSWGGLGA